MDSTTTTLFMGRMGVEFARNSRYHPLLPREIFGIPGVFLWNLIFILVLTLIFYWLLRSSRQTHETPMDLLKKRYINEEIDKKTFEEMKKTISD